MTRITIAVAALACAACTPVEGEPEPIAGLSTERQCFFTSQINGYGDAPGGAGERLYVNTGPNDRWLFETFGPCTELDWAFRIALDTGPSSSLCTGDTATLIVPRSLAGRPDRCSVRLLGKMTEAPRERGGG